MTGVLSAAICLIESKLKCDGWHQKKGMLKHPLFILLCLKKLVLFSKEAFGVNGCHAPRASCRNGLTIDRILHIATGKYAGNIGFG